MNLLWHVVIMFGVMLSDLCADERTVQFRVTGLFDPQRVDDLKAQVAQIENIRLVEVDYDTAVVTFAYGDKLFSNPNVKPEQIERAFRERVSQASRGGFAVLPLSTFPREKWEEVRIAVAGHDCKGCNYGLYRIVAAIDGVERAVASFKEGHVTAWIDPAKTNREALVEALKKREVTVVEGL